jgi:hypothetical protein
MVHYTENRRLSDLAQQACASCVDRKVVSQTNSEAKALLLARLSGASLPYAQQSAILSTAPTSSDHDGYRKALKRCHEMKDLYEAVNIAEGTSGATRLLTGRESPFGLASSRRGSSISQALGYTCPHPK